MASGYKKIATKQTSSCKLFKSNRYPLRSVTNVQVCEQIEPMDPSHIIFCLPDILLIIFDNLPLIDLIRVGRVCRRWHQLQPLIYARKRSLRLYSYCNYDYTNPNINENVREKMDLLRFFELNPEQADFIIGVEESLYRQWVDLEQGCLRRSLVGKYPLVNCNFVVDKLCSTFPNITKLTVFDCKLTETEVIKLCSNWRYKLTTLHIVMIKIGFDWSKVLQAVNGINSLEHLSLFLIGGVSWNATVLSQLKTFNFGYHDYYFGLNRTCLYQLFSQLSPDRLQHFGFGFFSAHTHSGPFVRRNFRKLLKEKPFIADRLSRVKLPMMPKLFLSFLCKHFRSITWLDIVFNSLRDLNEVAKLKQLSHLSIRSNSRPYSISPLDTLSRPKLAQLPQLGTVQHLFVLDFAIRDDILQIIFPRARVNREARGDQNEVDYLKVDDAVNVNLFNWRRIGANHAQFHVAFNEARRRIQHLLGHS